MQEIEQNDSKLHSKHDETLQLLGLTLEELQERAVKRIVRDVMRTGSADDEGEWHERRSEFADAIQTRSREAIDDAVRALAEKHVLPKVQEQIENVILQRTSKWGEPDAAPISFIEYLVQRAEHYIKEPVDYEGKAEGESRRSSINRNRNETTRIAYMIDKHLQYSITTAMEKALESANKTIVEGIEQAVKMRLVEVSKRLNVKVEVK